MLFWDLFTIGKNPYNKFKKSVTDRWKKMAWNGWIIGKKIIQLHKNNLCRKTDQKLKKKKKEKLFLLKATEILSSKSENKAASESLYCFNKRSCQIQWKYVAVLGTVLQGRLCVRHFLFIEELLPVHPGRYIQILLLELFIYIGKSIKNKNKIKVFLFCML